MSNIIKLPQRRQRASCTRGSPIFAADGREIGQSATEPCGLPLPCPYHDAEQQPEDRSALLALCVGVALGWVCTEVWHGLGLPWLFGGGR